MLGGEEKSLPLFHYQRQILTNAISDVIIKKVFYMGMEFSEKVKTARKMVIFLHSNIEEKEI